MPKQSKRKKRVSYTRLAEACCETFFLPQVMEEAQAAAQAPPHTFSPAFDTRMAELLRPNCEKKHRRCVRLRLCRATLAVVTVLVTSASFFAVSATPPKLLTPHIYLVDDPTNGADAKYIRFMDRPDVFSIGDFVDYTVSEGRKKPHKLPAGYTDQEVLSCERCETIIEYRNAQNETVTFAQYTLDVQMGADFGACDLTYLTFHGYDALYAYQASPTPYGQFYWVDDRYAYSLCGNLTKNEAISLAESVY